MMGAGTAWAWFPPGSAVTWALPLVAAEGASMEYRILGRLEVVRGGSPLPLGAPRHRKLLTILLVHADDVVNTLVQDIPYDELAGVRIGEDFSTGVATSFTGGARKVSMALTTACPVCSGAVAPGVNPCPHCGATLDWAA